MMIDEAPNQENGCIHVEKWISTSPKISLEPGHTKQQSGSFARILEMIGTYCQRTPTAEGSTMFALQ